PTPAPDSAPAFGPAADWEEEWERQAGARARRRRLALAAVGVVAILGLLGGALAILLRGDDGTSGSGAQPDPTEPSDPTGSADLATTVEEISAFVEEARGLEFREPVDVELAAGEEFEQRLLEDFDEDVEELEATGTLLTAFGLIDPSVDVVEAMRSLLGGGVVGFYDPETEELVVRGDDVTPYVRTTIAHELVHALDDQHFELHRPEYDDAPDEVGFGLSAVAEGDARRIEDAYRATMSDAELAEARREELALAAGLDITSVPLVLVQLLQSQYDDGQRFVESILDAGGQEALDRAFEDPPRTSEQVLDPDRYLEGEGRMQVPHPEPDGEVVDEGVVGQQLIQLVLIGAAEPDDAALAADGWGGDWSVVWRDGDRSCATMTVVGDTADDTEELREAFAQWAEEQDDATVSRGPEGTVTVEACAG
ncbi:MAG TPA: hypothetical protein VIL48_22680, partial [Acidimicrobiales bacterium]